MARCWSPRTRPSCRLSAQGRRPQAKGFVHEELGGRTSCAGWCRRCPSTARRRGVSRRDGAADPFRHAGLPAPRDRRGAGGDRGRHRSPASRAAGDVWRGRDQRRFDRGAQGG
jgi:hypothetical protein